MRTEIERFAQIIRRRLHIIVIVCVCGVALSPLLPRFIHATYDATARLLVVTEAAKDSTLTSTDLPSIATSSDVFDRVKRRLTLDASVDLSKGATAKVLPHSSIMQVSYRDREGQRAADIANAIAEETVAYYREISAHRYDDVTLQLTQKSDQLRAQIDAVNRRLQAATVHNPYANSDKAMEDLKTRIDALRAQRDEANAELLADRASSNALSAQGPKIAGIVRQEILDRDPVYKELQAQLAKDEAALEEKRVTYTPSNPVVVFLADQVALERTQLRSAEATALQNGSGSSPSYASNVLEQRQAAGKVAADEARVRSLETAIADAEKHFGDIVGPSAPVAALRAERDAAQQQYLALTQRLSAAQADAAQAASLGSLVLVDRAVPKRTAFQSLIAYFPLFYSLFICTFAIVAAYVAESFDRRFWEAKDLEDAYGARVFEIGE